MSVPRVRTVEVTVGKEKEFSISPISDLHIEARDFPNDEFQEFLTERNKLPGHRAILIGDVMDLVVPVDLRRWRASTQDASLAGRDDWLNGAVDLAVERLTASGTKYDLVSPGNHEDEFIKRHGVDTTSMLARELRCARGGYSGYIRYVVKSEIGKTIKPVGNFNICYHHGAWGGRLVKGFGGARDYFRAFDSWHVALFGHNHQSVINRETKLRPGRNGNLVEYPVYYVCTGTWIESYSKDAQRTHYAERHGYMPTPRQSPLIRVKVNNHGTGREPRGIFLTYTVEM